MAQSKGVVPVPHALQSSKVDFSKPFDKSNLKGKVILITGGASGLGAGFFKAWAPHGAVVIIGDRNEAAGRTLVQEVRSSTKNNNLYFLKLDVTDWQSQLAFFDAACNLSPHGGIDCVVANAGIASGPESDAFENPPNYQKMKDPPAPKLSILDVNLTGVMYTAHLAASYLPRNPDSQKCSLDASSNLRDRHLILVSSMAGLSPLPTQSVYCVSKHAVVGLFRSLRVTASITHGIRVNMINPYFVVTPILGILGAATMAGGGVADVEDVIKSATRLVADQSIIGRGLIVGPKAMPNEAEVAGLDVADSEHDEGAVWDVYAHDFDQSDVFVRRVVALTNMVANRRGWAGLLGDLGWAVIAPLRNLMGF